MKEKEEYHKSGMKSDTKSQMSRMTKASRTSDNAFMYTEQDQQRM